MDIIQHTSIWVKGDVYQGRIMLLAGVILLLAGIAIIKTGNPFFKGTLIPLGIVLILLLGYGGFVNFSRPAHLESIKTGMTQEPEQTLQKELQKMSKDHKTYSTLVPIWAILIAISGILLFFLSNEYFKGLSVGFVGLFLIAILVDHSLNQRLAVYLEAIGKFTGHGT